MSCCSSLDVGLLSSNVSFYRARCHGPPNKWIENAKPRADDGNQGISSPRRISASKAKPQRGTLTRAFGALVKQPCLEEAPGAVHLAESFQKYSAGKDELSQEANEASFALTHLAYQDRLLELPTSREHVSRQVDGSLEN